MDKNLRGTLLLKVHLFFYISLLILGCENQSLHFDNQKNEAIVGEVKLLSSSLSASSVGKFNCSAEVVANLYSTNVAGQLGESLAQGAVDDQFKYVIDIRGLDLDLNSELNYFVLVEGCDEPLIRPLTGLSSQDVSFVTSLVSQVPYVENSAKKELNQVSRKAIVRLLEKMESVSGRSFKETFESLVGDSSLSQDFEEIFQLPITEIFNSRPRVRSWSQKEFVGETDPAVFAVSASHWHPDYTIAYLWRLDGSDVSQNTNYTWYPTKNSQGVHTLEFFMGKDDGSGSIDLSEAYWTRVVTITVEDTFPAAPPTFTILEGVATNTTNIQLSLNTGPAQSNCDSFSDLAISVDDPNPVLDSANYTTVCSASPTQVVTLNLSPGEGNKVIRIWARDAIGTISTPASSQSIILDQTTPLVNLTDPSATVRGGDAINLNFSASDAVSGLASTILEFAQDGVNFSQILGNVSGLTNFSWTVPAIDVGGAKLRITAIDQAGNSQVLESSAFDIDSTPPAAPVVTRLSPALSNSQILQYQVSSCVDRTELFASESAVTPELTDGGWFTCVTSPQNFSVSAGDAVKTVYFFARDGVGNISLSASISFILDQTPPQITLVTDLSGQILSGNSTQLPAINTGSLDYSVVEANGLSAGSVEIQHCTSSCHLDPQWSSHQSGLTYGGGVDTLAWLRPEIDSSLVQIRLKAMDAAGNENTSVSSSVFTIDSTAPVVTNFEVNNGNSAAAGVALPLSASISDNLSSNLEYRIGLSSDLSGFSWVASLTSIFNLPFVSGTYDVYLESQDEAGNISALAVTNSVDLVLGEPPIVVITEPVEGSSWVNPGDPVELKWEINTPSGFALKSDGIRVEYSTDFGATSIPWPGASGLSPTVNGGCSLSGAATGCATLSFPAALFGERFQIALFAEDTSSAEGVGVSNNYNAIPNLSLIAGNDAAVLGGSSLSTMLDYSNSSSVIRDPVTGDIYLARPCDILMVEGATGKVTRWAGNPSECFSAGDGLPLASYRMSSIRKIRMDSQRNLIWLSDSRIWKYDRITGLMEILVGPAEIPTSGTTGTDARKFSGGITEFMIGKDDQLYFTQELNNGLCSPPNTIRNISKVWKVETDNTVTHLYGDPDSCVYASNGAMASGVMFFSVALVPGDESTDDRLYVQATTAYQFHVFSIEPDGSLLEKVNQGGSGNRVWMYDYNPVHGIPLIGQYRVNFWHPDTDVFQSNTHTLFDRPTNGAAVDLFSDPMGGYYYLTNPGNYISYVSVDNNHAVVAGVNPAYGDGGPATLAQLRNPSELSFDLSGNMYINDGGNLSARMVAPDGTISTPWGGNGQILATGETTEGVINYQHGMTSSDGKNGRLTLSINDGRCLFLCGTSSDSYLATLSSGLGSVTLWRGNGGFPNGLNKDRWSFDGTNAWVHLEEFVSSWNDRRAYIYKFDNITGDFVRIAGDHTLPDDAIGLVDGQSVSGTHAGVNLRRFQVVNDVMYSSDGSLYTATEAGVWTRQTLNCGVSGRFAVLPDNNYIYTCGTRIYLKAYQADGLGASTEVVDLAGQISGSIRNIATFSGDNGAVYFTVNNSVFRFYDPLLQY